METKPDLRGGWTDSRQSSGTDTVVGTVPGTQVRFSGARTLLTSFFLFILGTFEKALSYLFLLNSLLFEFLRACGGDGFSHPNPSLPLPLLDSLQSRKELEALEQLYPATGNNFSC